MLFSDEYVDHNWYIDERNVLVIEGQPLVKFAFVDVRQKKKTINKTQMLFWDFDYGKIYLANEK